MTTPPRLAPLETMTEAQFDGAYYSVWPCSKLHDEVQAQRLARARERREALEEAISCVPTAWWTNKDVEVVFGALRRRLEALRDREEA